MNVRRYMLKGSAVLGIALSLAACSSENLDSEEEIATVSETGIALRLDGTPVTVPEDYVATPFGYTHPACIQQLDEDEENHGRQVFRRGDSRVKRTVSACPRDRFSRAGERIPYQVDEAPKPSKSGSTPPLPRGWIADVVSVTQGPIRRLTADWGTPNRPNTRNSQTLYFFPGLEDSPTTRILQPVLGWNMADGRDNAYSLASWDCCVEGVVWHSPIIAASSFDRIHGEINGTNCNSSTGVCANWTVTTSNVSSGVSTTLTTRTPIPAMRLSFGAAVEAYKMSQCSQWVSSNAEFTNIISTGFVPFSNPDPVWTVEQPQQSCGMSFDRPTRVGTFGWKTTAARR